MALVHVNSVCGLCHHEESTVLKWLQHICSEHYGRNRWDLCRKLFSKILQRLKIASQQTSYCVKPRSIQRNLWNARLCLCLSFWAVHLKWKSLEARKLRDFPTSLWLFIRMHGFENALYISGVSAKKRETPLDKLMPWNKFLKFLYNISFIFSSPKAVSLSLLFSRIVTQTHRRT